MKQERTGSVARGLAKLGADIRDARRRRQMTAELLADRASMTRVTLGRVERGDPRTSIGAYAEVLNAMGMLDRLSEAADPRYDVAGQAYEEESLPQRVRSPRR